MVLSGPPSRVLLDERIAIPHPRDVFTLRETPQFTAHVQSLWACWANSSAPPPETGRHDFRDDSPP